MMSSSTKAAGSPARAIASCALGFSLTRLQSAWAARCCAASDPVESSSMSICVTWIWFASLSRPREPRAAAARLDEKACPIPSSITSGPMVDASAMATLMSVASDSDQSAPATSAFTGPLCDSFISDERCKTPPIWTTAFWFAGLPHLTREAIGMHSDAINMQPTPFGSPARRT